MIVSRPASPADVALFYPGLTASVRAWICEVDGEVAGIIGVAMTRPAHSVFSVVTDPLKPYLRSVTILRLIKRLEAVLATLKAPIFAIREPGVREAPHILKRLGFRFHMLLDGDAVYRWEGC